MNWYHRCLHRMTRLSQVVRYGWKHAGEVNKNCGCGNKRIYIYIDILRCYFQYKMFSNEYVSLGIYKMNKTERSLEGNKCKEKRKKQELWQERADDYYHFFGKYGSLDYQVSAAKREARQRAYTKRYHTGKGLRIDYDVSILQSHDTNGEISVGNNVLFGKHTLVDYSGNVTIEDDVELSNNVIIESHHHPYHTDYKLPHDAVESNIIIKKGAFVGARTVVLPSCHYIGKYARIGAGAVVTKDVPDYAIAAGVPAKVIRIMEHEGDTK